MEINNYKFLFSNQKHNNFSSYILQLHVSVIIIFSKLIKK